MVWSSLFIWKFANFKNSSGMFLLSDGLLRYRTMMDESDCKSSIANDLWLELEGR